MALLFRPADVQQMFFLLWPEALVFSQHSTFVVYVKGVALLLLLYLDHLGIGVIKLLS
jgi:hypothetical protein